MATDCVNERLDLREYAAERALLLDQLRAPPLFAAEPVSPFAAYSLLFGEVLSVNIQRRIHALYQSRLAAINAYTTGADLQKLHGASAALLPIEAGHLYVFRDVRDASPTIVKIGSTRTSVARRIGQWQRDLRATPDELYVLFSVECTDVRFAEALMHTLLFCQWLPKRVNAFNGHRLLEYFSVHDLRALRRLCTAVTRHVDWFMRNKNRRRNV